MHKSLEDAAIQAGASENLEGGQSESVCVLSIRDTGLNESLTPWTDKPSLDCTVAVETKALPVRMTRAAAKKEHGQRGETKLSALWDSKRGAK